MIYWINEDKLKWNYQKDFDNRQNQAKVFCDSIPPDSAKIAIPAPSAHSLSTTLPEF